MSPSIIDQISNVQINYICMQISVPCQHSCNFTFNDMECYSLHVSKPKIAGLIKHLPKEKLTVGNEDHFGVSACSKTEVENFIKQVHKHAYTIDKKNTDCNKCIIL